MVERDPVRTTGCSEPKTLEDQGYSQTRALTFLDKLISWYLEKKFRARNSKFSATANLKNYNFNFSRQTNNWKSKIGAFLSSQLADISKNLSICRNFEKISGKGIIKCFRTACEIVTFFSAQEGVLPQMPCEHIPHWIKMQYSGKISKNSCNSWVCWFRNCDFLTVAFLGGNNYLNFFCRADISSQKNRYRQNNIFLIFSRKFGKFSEI